MMKSAYFTSPTTPPPPLMTFQQVPSARPFRWLPRKLSLPTSSKNLANPWRTPSLKYPSML